MYFSFLNVFFYIDDNVCRDLCSVGHAKTSNCFSKIFKAKIEWQVILKRKINKSYDKSAVRNDPGNNTKKIVNLILENATPKAITEVYFELSVTNFYAQISCSCQISCSYASHSYYCVCLHKFSRLNQNVLLSYLPHKLRTKIMAQLNFVQRLQARSSWFSSKQYPTSLCMRRTN